jgi:wobble nucleotide-excising tRNase
MTAPRITGISRIKDYRSFRDFSWPTDLEPFLRFNLIYGWNGTGKTALSTIFRHLETRTAIDSEEGEVLLALGSTSVNGRDLATASVLQVRVFNRDTVKRSVFEDPAEDLPAVYYLGEESVAKQKSLLSARERLASELEAVTRHGTEAGRARASFETFCTNQARIIRDLLTTAGGGPYRNYQAPAFKAAAEALQAGVQDLTPLSQEDRRRYLLTKDDKDRDVLDLVVLPYPDPRGLLGKAQAVLSQSVISEAIPELSSHPRIAAWVGDGVQLHTGDYATTECRFCDQALPVDRLQRLEAHFDDRLRALLGAIDQQVAALEHAEREADAVAMPDARLVCPDLRQDYSEARKVLEAQVQSDRDSFRKVTSALLAKRSDPFMPTKVESDPGVLARPGAGSRPEEGGNRSLARLNSVIAAHNQYAAELAQRVKAARSELERDVVTRALSDYAAKKHAVEEADTGRREAADAAEKIREEVRELEVSTGETERAADELSKEMAIYLGRDELKFEPRGTGYAITRNGQPALHLSEGERSAISFIYFLKSLRDRNFEPETGIVVIDDPVSSLDANSLFGVFGLMKDRLSNAHQLFILTHDFAFFRLVRSWFQNLRGEMKHQAEYFMLDCVSRDGERTSVIRSLDDLLRKYDSEYHYLFRLLHDAAHRTDGPDALADRYSLPNIGRRLMETFLAFRFPHLEPETSFGKRLAEMRFDDPGEQYRIERFLHLGSHFDRVGEPEHDLSALSCTQQTLLEILRSIEMTDPDHYQGMLTAVGISVAANE